MPAALTLWLPLALGGESAGGESTGLAVISAISIVVGYALIAALWYFVFRDRGRGRRGRKRSG
ncbi:MAG TPA: hypothetical protein VGO14_11245 [Solirubrobacteraceae bacterium]|jgi:hypothetical protein|nr:hypothetical protein [Solirubrobacteraceae bacterium]